ncbi:hypothetical protein ACWEGQ_00420 [Streptomyces seoulensis]
MQQPAFEAIPSGIYSPAAVAQNDPELYADVTDVLDNVDLVDLTKDALDEPIAGKLAVTLVLDEWFGEVSDSYADEDES